MSEEIDCRHTEVIVCPHCGEVHGDSWERDDQGEDNCQACGKPFTWSRHTEVTYSTEKK